MKDQNEKEGKIKSQREAKGGFVVGEWGKAPSLCLFWAVCHPCLKVWGLLVFRFKCIHKKIGTGAPGEEWK